MNILNSLNPYYELDCFMITDYFMSIYWIQILCITCNEMHIDFL